jgi:hypothetical protein
VNANDSASTKATTATRFDADRRHAMTIGDVIRDVARDLETCHTPEQVDAAFARALDVAAQSVIDDFERTLHVAPVPDDVADDLRRDFQVRVVHWRRGALKRVRRAIQAVAAPVVVH